MNRQISRIALLYFLAVFSACVLSLSLFLPWWLIPFSGVCLLWRYLVFAGRLSFPSGWIKTSLVILSGTALFMQFGFAVSLDVFIMLLLLGFSLKLLEIYHSSDAMLLLYLSFFVMMTVFLYEQSFFYVVLVFVVALLILAAMIAIQSADSELQRVWSQPLRKGLLVSVLALPLMLLMFVVMPRLPPLWSMPLQQQQQARTGMSDSMSPGDIASLTKSAELAFRASFPDRMPDRRSLYWYGMLLDHFDGIRWTDSCKNCSNQMPKASPSAAELQAGMPYQVILEPHGARWLYVLLPSFLQDASVRSSIDGIASYNREITSRLSYAAILLASSSAQVGVLQDRQRFLDLPSTGNPRSRELATQWRREASNDRQLMQKALDFYHRFFSYTLQPPMLADQRIDDFLFNTRAGFCEHFASSFVFLMRAAGIPARVVIGYMGGEVNEQDRYVTVRQYDAHAWAEVWFPDTGWERVDPTAAVAPERVDLGFFGAFANDQGFVADIGLAAFRGVPLLNRLRLQLDRFDYLWSRWVLGYEGEQQQLLLKKLGLLSPMRIALFGAGAVVLVFVVFCLYLYWRDRFAIYQHPATRCYMRLCNAYSRYGVERSLSETPLQFAARVTNAGMFRADDFLSLSKEYYLSCYAMKNSRNVDLSPDFFRKSLGLYVALLFHYLKTRSLATIKTSKR